MDEVSKKEYIQDIINLLNCTERAYNVITNTIKREQEYCKDKFIPLARIYP